MELKENLRESFIVILAALILAVTVSFKNQDIFMIALQSFLIIIGLNIIVKKGIGYYLETNVKTKFWSIYQYGFPKNMHFKKPVPMIWFPLIIALFTKGFFWWLAILEFDITAKTERVSRRHGLYRFSQVTEWHMAWIAAWGIITSLALAAIGYVAGFETFARLSLFYAVWSIIPLSNLDGSKIFFSSRGLWITFFTILLIFFSWSQII